MDLIPECRRAQAAVSLQNHEMQNLPPDADVIVVSQFILLSHQKDSQLYVLCQDEITKQHCQHLLALYA